MRPSRGCRRASAHRVRCLGLCFLLTPSVFAELGSGQALPELEALRPVPGGLTGREVAERAVRASPAVRAKREELALANAQIRQTTIQFFPRFTLNATYTRLSPVSAGFGSGALVGALNPGALSVAPCPSGMGQCVVDSQGVPVGASQFAIEYPNNNYALSATLTVPLSDYVLRLSHAAAAANASRAAARYAIAAERLRVRTEAHVLYLNWIRSKAQVSITDKALERVQARLKDAQAAFTAGSASRADVLRVEALLRNTELDRERALELRQLTEQQVAIAMGVAQAEAPAAEPARAGAGHAGTFRIGEDVMAPLDARAGAHSLAANTSSALSRRLELRTLTETVRSFRRGAESVRALGLPRVSAFGDITYANPNQRFFPPAEEWNATWAAGVSASFTINDAFQHGAAADELEANAASLSAQESALRDGIRQEVAAAHYELKRALLAITTTEQAVRAAEEAYRVMTDLYQVGRATTTDLIEAEADLLQARLGHANARIDARSAAVRLTHATGRDVDSAAAFAGPDR